MQVSPLTTSIWIYQKAFDTVPHKRLISKLKSYGFNQQITNWVKSFLTSRIQQVVVNGKKSRWMNVTSGIPQGSVLRPVLYVLFINDLPETVSSEVFLFADDTKIFKVIKGKEDQKRLQEDLDALNEWSEKWLLKFHPGKCKHMHVGKSVPDSVTYSLNSTNLQSTTQEKDMKGMRQAKWRHFNFDLTFSTLTRICIYYQLLF